MQNITSYLQLQVINNFLVLNVKQKGHFFYYISNQFFLLLFSISLFSIP